MAFCIHCGAVADLRCSCCSTHYCSSECQLEDDELHSRLVGVDRDDSPKRPAPPRPPNIFKTTNPARFVVTSEELRIEKLTQIKLKKLLGAGTFGRVWDICVGDSCSKVMKIQLLQRNAYNFISDTSSTVAQYKEEFGREVFFSRLAGIEGFGPKVYWSKVIPITRLDILSEDLGFDLSPDEIGFAGLLISEKYENTLWNLPLTEWCPGVYWRNNQPVPGYVRENALYVRAAFDLHMRKLRQLRIVHADISASNIMVRREGKMISGLVIIDYGRAFHASRQPSIDLFALMLAHNSQITSKRYPTAHPFGWKEARERGLKHMRENNSLNTLQKPEILDEFVIIRMAYATQLDKDEILDLSIGNEEGSINIF